MKILFDTPEFKVFQGRVTKCKMHVNVVDCCQDALRHLPLFDMVNEVMVEIGQTGFDFNIEAITKCSPKDNFDKVTGERIAESKATIKALKIAKEVLASGEKRLVRSFDQNATDYLRLHSILDREEKHLNNLIK